MKFFYCFIFPFPVLLILKLYCIVFISISFQQYLISFFIIIQKYICIDFGYDVKTVSNGLKQKMSLYLVAKADKFGEIEGTISFICKFMFRYVFKTKFNLLLSILYNLYFKCILKYMYSYLLTHTYFKIFSSYLRRSCFIHRKNIL